MLTLKDHIAGNCEFQYYRAGNLMYKTSTGLDFPIPVSDTNDATFPRTEKGIFFMRWIRKHLEDNNLTLDVSNVTLEDCRSNHFNGFFPKSLEEHAKNKFTP
jgi:hypothetical protein